MTAISHRIGLVSLVCVVMFGACSTSTSDRDACYAKAEQAAAEKTDKLCPVGDAGPDAKAWDECSARGEIVAELKKAHRSCK